MDLTFASTMSISHGQINKKMPFIFNKHLFQTEFPRYVLLRTITPPNDQDDIPVGNHFTRCLFTSFLLPLEIHPPYLALLHNALPHFVSFHHTLPPLPLLIVQQSLHHFPQKVSVWRRGV